MKRLYLVYRDGDVRHVSFPASMPNHEAFAKASYAQAELVGVFTEEAFLAWLIPGLEATVSKLKQGVIHG